MWSLLATCLLHVKMAASSASGSSTRKPQSQVWKFFEKASDKSVSCCICHANLAFHGGTSSMKEHLKRKHPTEDPLRRGTSRESPRALIKSVMHT